MSPEMEAEEETDENDEGKGSWGGGPWMTIPGDVGFLEEDSSGGAEGGGGGGGWGAESKEGDHGSGE